MSSTKSLLVELFVEELPPKALKKLGEAFAQMLASGLKSRGLTTEHSAITAYATPRRLAVHMSAVASQAQDEETTKKLMPVSVGLGSDGKPTAALRKNLAKLGREPLADMWPNAKDGPDALFVQSDGKVDAIFFRTLAKGSSLLVGLQGALEDTIEGLPIPKAMSYQLADGWRSVNFVRPAHGLVALHGPDVVPVTALGLDAGRATRGHRFEAQFDPIELQHADHYAQTLETQGAVIAAFERRRADIVRQLQHAAAPLGLVPIDDDALLDEVTALVERPNVLLCQFEPEFLAVPPECLILTMKANQKYFPLLDAQGKLTNRFLVVSNIRPDDASAIVQGNERVVRPRLADAKFFFDQDRKKTLESRLPALDKVVYHAKLGSLGARVERVRAIAKAIGGQLGGAALAAQADRAAQLAKADLVTDMVGEFPELQGIMGGYYARHDGESDEVAAAIAAQYVVRRDEEEHAENLVGESLLLADRIETLVGIWGIGLKPTGDKDPFALRRHALGVIRSIELCAATATIAQRDFTLKLPELLSLAEATFPVGQIAPGTLAELETFIFERYQNQLSSVFDVRAVDAVTSMRPPLHTVVRRLHAVRAFLALSEAASLAAANKRIANILKKSDGAVPAAAVDAARLVEPAEKALAGALHQVVPIADALFDNAEYAASLRELAVLKGPVDAFFDGVMVNADDPALRANRLALLATLHASMNRVADLSKLAT